MRGRNPFEYPTDSAERLGAEGLSDGDVDTDPKAKAKADRDKLRLLEELSRFTKYQKGLVKSQGEETEDIEKI